MCDVQLLENYIYKISSCPIHILELINLLLK